MGQSNLVENEQILENEAENVFVLVTRLTAYAFVTKIPNDSAKNVPLQKMEISVVWMLPVKRISLWNIDLNLCRRKWLRAGYFLQYYYAWQFSKDY